MLAGTVALSLIGISRGAALLSPVSGSEAAVLSAEAEFEEAEMIHFESVETMLFASGADLSSVLESSSLIPSTLDKNTLNQLNNRCYLEDDPSWPLWFSGKFSNCGTFLKDALSDDVMVLSKHKESSAHQSRECAELISYMVTNVDLGHWSCGPLLSCFLAKLLQVLPPNFDCISKPRCWTLLKGINFWRTLVRAFGFAFKRSMDRSSGKNFSVMVLRDSAAIKVLADVFLKSQRPDHVLWYQYQCEPKSFNSCILLTSRPMDWKAIVNQYVTCHAKTREAQSREVCSADLEGMLGHSPRDSPFFWMPSDCAEVDEFIRAMVTDSNCLHMIPCLLVGGSLLGHGMKQLSCNDEEIKKCVQNHAFADDLLVNDLDPDAQVKENLQTYLRTQVYSFSTGGALVGASNLHQRAVQRGDTEGQFLFQKLEQDNSKPMEEIRQCVANVFLRKNLLTKNADDLVCPFELFLRMRRAEMQFKPGPVYFNIRDREKRLTLLSNIMLGYPAVEAVDDRNIFSVSPWNYLDMQPAIPGSFDQNFLEAIDMKVQDPERARGLLSTESYIVDDLRRTSDYEKSVDEKAAYRVLLSDDKYASLESDINHLAEYQSSEEELFFLPSFRSCVADMERVIGRWSFQVLQKQGTEVYVGSDDLDEDPDTLAAHRVHLSEVDILDTTIFDDDRPRKMRRRMANAVSSKENQFVIKDHQWERVTHTLNQCFYTLSVSTLDPEICNIPGCTFSFSVFRGCMMDAARQFLLSRDEIAVDCKERSEDLLTGCSARLSGREFEELAIDCALSINNAVSLPTEKTRFIYAWEKFRNDVSIGDKREVNGASTFKKSTASSNFLGGTHMLFKAVMSDKLCAEDADTLAEYAMQCTNALQLMLPVTYIGDPGIFFKKAAFVTGVGGLNCAQVFSKLEHWEQKCDSLESMKWWSVFYSMLSRVDKSRTGILIYVLLCARGRCPPRAMGPLGLYPSPSSPIPSPSPDSFKKAHDECLRLLNNPDDYALYIQCMTKAVVSDEPSSWEKTGRATYESDAIYIKQCLVENRQEYTIFSKERKNEWENEMVQRPPYCSFYEETVRGGYIQVLSNVIDYAARASRDVPVSTTTMQLIKKMWEFQLRPSGAVAEIYRHVTDVMALDELENIVLRVDPTFHLDDKEYSELVTASVQYYITQQRSIDPPTYEDTLEKIGKLYVWLAERERLNYGFNNPLLTGFADPSNNKRKVLTILHGLAALVDAFTLSYSAPTVFDIHQDLIGGNSDLTEVYEAMRETAETLVQPDSTENTQYGLSNAELISLFNTKNLLTDETMYRQVQWAFHIFANPQFKETKTYLPMSSLIIVPRATEPLRGVINNFKKINRNLDVIKLYQELLASKKPLAKSKYILHETVPLITANEAYCKQISDTLFALRFWQEDAASSTSLALANLPERTDAITGLSIYFGLVSMVELLNMVVLSLAIPDMSEYAIWESSALLKRLALIAEALFDTPFRDLPQTILKLADWDDLHTLTQKPEYKMLRSFLVPIGSLGHCLKFNREPQLSDPVLSGDQSQYDAERVSLWNLAFNPQKMTNKIERAQILYEFQSVLSNFYEKVIPSTVAQINYLLTQEIVRIEEDSPEMERLEQLLIVFAVSQAGWEQTWNQVMEFINRVIDENPREMRSTTQMDGADRGIMVKLGLKDIAKTTRQILEQPLP